MKRTSVYLTDDLDRLLQEMARRTHRPRAEIVRDALSQYLDGQPRPWPRSVGMGTDADPSVTSDNVTQWVRDQWRREIGRSYSPDVLTLDTAVKATAAITAPAQKRRAASRPCRIATASDNRSASNAWCNRAASLLTTAATRSA